MKGAPLRKTRSWAAIVFGDQAVGVTTARPAGDGIRVEMETSEALAAPVEGQTSAARLQATATTLRQRVDLGEHRIVTAIGCEDVLCQTLQLPSTDADEVKQMLALQLDNLTPLPVEEIVYSYEPLEQVGNETRLLVAVARKAAVNERVAALEAVGWRPEAVGVDALAVFRELLRHGALPADAKLNTAVLISPLATHLIVYASSKILVVRSLVLDAAALQDPAVQSSLRQELSWTRMAAKVGQIDREDGQLTFATWSESLRPHAEELARLWGTGAEFLQNEVSADPARCVCLEAAQPGGTQLNLLPEEWRERRRKARVRQLLVRGAIGLAAVYILGLATFLILMTVKQAQLNGLEREAGRLRPAFKEARELQKTLGAMEKQLDRKYSALEVLREVCQMMPENVKLNRFNFKRDDMVVLRAQAQSATLATDFSRQLENSELFSRVVAGSQRIEPGTGLTQFDVTCTLKSAAAVPTALTYGH